MVAPGCSSAPDLQPKGQAVVTATADGRRTYATVRLLNEVVVQLPPITTPGNHWVLVSNDERFLDPRGPIEPGPHGATARFLAIRVGRRLVRFFALPAGREVVPTQDCELMFEIE